MKNIQLLILLMTGIIITSFVQKNIGRNESKNSDNNSIAPISASPTSIQKELSPTIALKNLTPTTIQNQNTSKTDINFYRYPNSQVEESSGSRLVLNSIDDPSKITEWYTQKLKNQNLSVNSFVKTKTNENVLNKLVSSNRSIKISVEIIKKNSDTFTKIKINI